ncbi:MAG: CHAT domain-containing protein [Alphaproteobacteria bacterium]|nr:CHAT domain-containing protein [Alphaproteobacteria bacterium]
MRRGFLASLLFAAAALAGCEKPPPEAFISTSKGEAGQAAAAVPVGNNDAGEACRYQLAAPGSTGVSSRRDALLYCGNWEEPSGRIFDLGDAGSTGGVGSVVASGTWRAYVEQRFACGAPSSTTFAGGSAQILTCTRRIGGWPHVALAADVGGHVFGADAVRPALPALQSALASLTGQAVAVAAPRSEAQRIIAERTVGGAFGSGDEGRYFQLTRLGDAYNNVDDPADAERSFREALAIQEKILGANDPGLALTVMKLAAQVAHEGNGAEADRLLTRAEQLAGKRPDALVQAQLNYYRAVTSAYEGKAQDALAQSQVAEQSFTRLVPDAVARAQAPARKAAPSPFEAVLSDDSASATQERTALSGLAEAIRLHATLLLQNGKNAEAVALGQRAEQLLRANGLAVSSTGARSLRLLASNQAIGGNFVAASGITTQATQVFETVVPGTHPDAESLLRQGAYQARAKQMSEARDSFRRAGEILSRPSYQGDVSVPPELVLPWLETLQATNAPAPEMFQAAQFGQSGQTAALIAQATARLVAGDPKVADAIRAYQDRKRDFEQLQGERDRAVADNAGADRIGAVDKRIEQAKQAQNEAEQAILAAAPQYLKAVEKPAGLDEVRALLGPNEAFVMFFVANEGSFGFVVRQGGTTAYPIPMRRLEIAQMINRLRDTTIVKPAGIPTPDFGVSYKLYSALFGPAEKQLQGVDRITIAANGDLLRYPLEALVTQANAKDDNGDYRKVPFLVRQAALTYVPSPRILVNIRQGRNASTASRSFIGFGDFQPATQAQLAASFPPDRCRDDLAALSALPKLPETRTQVTTIAQQMGGGTAVVGEEFTKQRLAQSDVGQYHIVLLATHAFLPDSLRCFSEPAITVSVPPRAPNADSEFLRTGDIDQLKLNADLVALSACDTAGSGAVGESLSGLARSFFRAGAHGLLVTHWPIVTGAAVPLMIGTFGSQGGARDSAQALRAAQLKVIDTAGSSQQAPVEISHPNYWAGFVLIGDGVRGGPGA